MTRRSGSAVTPEERARAGDAARERVPPEHLAETGAGPDRDPVGVLTAQDLSRIPDLVPLRHERMAASPFAFYRGAAAVMAADLAGTPTSGFPAQLCGDAHLSNFGMFASPERRLLFDLNDFDETCPGPWEWDLKRLLASLVVAGRQNGFPAKRTRKAVLAAARTYRDAVTRFAGLSNLEVWYARVDVAEARELLAGRLDDRMTGRLDRAVSKARSRDHRRSLAKLTEVVDGRRRFVADPPIVVPVADLAPDLGEDQLASMVVRVINGYAGSLPPGTRELVHSYRFVDLARKVVGVGSVGTRCWIVLLEGRDHDDPLVLQVKEAQRSVLAQHLPAASGNRSEGARVVAGQRLMQAAGDAFLGWQRVVGLDGVSRDFYVRQLQDWKGALEPDRMRPKGLDAYGQLCAWTLARAHARSGDRIAVAAYLGDDDAAAQALADFAESYADQNERDHAAFAAAVRSGELGAP